MKNHIDDAIAEQSLLHMLANCNLSFKTYIFTANDLSQVPQTLLLSQDLQMRQAMLELTLARNKIESVDLRGILKALPNLERLDLSQNLIKTMLSQENNAAAEN